MTQFSSSKHMKSVAFLLMPLIVLGAILNSFTLSSAQEQPSVRSARVKQQAINNTPSALKRHALVIGNSDYMNVPMLKNPVNDATDMAAILESLGFEVRRGLNLQQREMKQMIRAFGQQLKDGGQGLFYFAGHGIQMRGRNYLIPVDAAIQNEADVEDLSVDMNLILEQMDLAGNELNIVILDACRNNPFARSFRSIARGLVQVKAPQGTLIAYATSPDDVASDGNSRNGLYTAELLKQIRTPGAAIEQVLKRVAAAVQQQTRRQQVPWFASSLIADFYFIQPAVIDNNPVPDTMTLTKHNPEPLSSPNSLAKTETGQPSAEVRYSPESIISVSKQPASIDTEKSISELRENIDKFTLKTELTILFNEGKSDLTIEALIALEKLSGQIKDTPTFLLEIEGFDSSGGDAKISEQLSQARAEAVRDYFSNRHKVQPLRMSVLGFGQTRPLANNSTSEGRKQNRRVVVRLLTNN